MVHVRFLRWMPVAVLRYDPPSREYNWYSLPDTNDPTGVEYVPMFHDGGSLEGFATNSPKWPGLGVKNLLSLNEPDVRSLMMGIFIS